MILAVASGKGGTGKTLVAVNLALSLEQDFTQLLDCDVEEPNAHLFVKPEFSSVEEVNTLVPLINEEFCDHCGKCARFCQFNALFVTPRKAFVFPELCKSCGACALVCPRGAITENYHRIGLIKHGSAGSLDFVYGELKVGEPLAVPLIKEVKKRISRKKLLFSIRRRKLLYCNRDGQGKRFLYPCFRTNSLRIERS